MIDIMIVCYKCTGLGLKCKNGIHIIDGVPTRKAVLCDACNGVGYIKKK